MKQSLLYTILFFAFVGVLSSCDKKKSKDKNTTLAATDSIYFYALVDTFTFTGINAKAVYAGGADNPYVIITSETGTDSTDKVISLRIDNFAHQPGTYTISPGGDAKASYKRSSKKTEYADSGRITIHSIGNSLRGSFYFYTEHHRVSGGTFSAQ
ncbi:MAG: hypothetical protein JNL72_12200 [Flavipsychrobacter sp.]|nr:hypothetical protein [Flavipsychrobacter sp.]